MTPPASSAQAAMARSSSSSLVLIPNLISREKSVYPVGEDSDDDNEPETTLAVYTGGAAPIAPVGSNAPNECTHELSKKTWQQYVDEACEKKRNDEKNLVDLYNEIKAQLNHTWKKKTTTTVFFNAFRKTARREFKVFQATLGLRREPQRAKSRKWLSVELFSILLKKESNKMIFSEGLERG